MNRNRLTASILSITSALLLSVFSLGAPARAEITVIPQPDAEYQDATTKIDIPDDVQDGTVLEGITDETLTVAFAPPVYKSSVPDNWATWSSPPESESDTPQVLVNEDLSLTIDLSRPVTTFGFELQPFSEGPFNFDADFVFMNGGEPTIVETINRTVGGRHGARLFAATSEDELPFNRIVINGGDYFALAQIRYQGVEEPEERDVEIDIIPGSSKNRVQLFTDRLIPVAILSGPDDFGVFFDATTVVPRTVCFGDGPDPRLVGDCTEEHKTGHIEDVDGDGDSDMLFHFNTPETGIDPDDTEACLKGETSAGVPITGCDVVEPRDGGGK